MALSLIHKIPTNVYGHLGPQAAIKRITEVLEAQNGTTASATLTNAGTVKKAAVVPVASDAATAISSFNALRTSLINAGVLAAA